MITPDYELKDGDRVRAIVWITSTIEYIIIGTVYFNRDTGAFVLWDEPYHGERLMRLPDRRLLEIVK